MIDKTVLNKKQAKCKKFSDFSGVIAESIFDVARRLSVSKGFIHLKVRCGTFPAPYTKTGYLKSKPWRFDPVDVDKWVVSEKAESKNGLTYLDWYQLLVIMDRCATSTNKEISSSTGAQLTEVSQLTRLMHLTGYLEKINRKDSKIITYIISEKGREAAQLYKGV